MMRNRRCSRTVAAIVALSSLLPAMGAATPAWAQAANQLCAAAGMGAGCIGTPKVTGVGGGGMGGLNGMSNAVTAIGLGLSILDMLQDNAAETAAPAAVADQPAQAIPANLGGYTTTAPASPSTTSDTVNFERSTLLDQMHPIDGGGDAGAGVSVQATKTALINQMHPLGDSGEAASANARVPFDTAGASAGNTAANQLCTAAGLSSGCIGSFQSTTTAPGAGPVPGGGGSGPSPAPNRVVRVSPPAPPSSNSSFTGGTIGGTAIGIDSTAADGGTTAGVSTASGGASANGQPCNQISGYQLTTGALGSTQVNAQITPCSGASPPSDGVVVDIYKPVPLLRAPTEPPPSAAGLDRIDVPTPTVTENVNPLPAGYILGTTIGENSAQWYADQYVATGKWRYVIGGGFASLWTPDTYMQTITVLALAEAAGTYLGRPYWQYYPASNPAYKSAWFTRGWGWDQPYTLGSDAISKLSLPPWNTADAVQTINPPWWQYVAGPRTVAADYGQFGGGIEYHLGAFPP